MRWEREFIEDECGCMKDGGKGLNDTCYSRGHVLGESTKGMSCGGLPKRKARKVAGHEVLECHRT